MTKNSPAGIIDGTVGVTCGIAVYSVKSGRLRQTVRPLAFVFRLLVLPWGIRSTASLMFPMLALGVHTIAQMKLMLPAMEDDPGINSALAEICQVLRVGFEDKIAQVQEPSMQYEQCRYDSLFSPFSVIYWPSLSSICVVSISSINIPGQFVGMID